MRHNRAKEISARPEPVSRGLIKGSVLSHREVVDR